MTIYIVEKKLGKEWNPLVNCTYLEEGEHGIAAQIISCATRKKEATLRALELVRERFPNYKFRIMEYKRV